MTLIVLFIAMTAAAMVLGPLLREHQAPKRVTFDLQVYQDRLLELERDRASGLIDSNRAETARVEIERRMLAASDKQRESAREAAGVMKSTAVRVALAFVVPVFCSPLSVCTANATEPAMPQPAMPTGSVGGTFQPSAEQRAEIRALPKAEQDQRIDATVDGLEQRLMTSTPNDLDGWMMLGRSRNALGDQAAAGAAYRRALALLSPDDPRRGNSRRPWRHWAVKRHRHRKHRSSSQRLHPPHRPPPFSQTQSNEQRSKRSLRNSKTRPSGRRSMA